MRARRQVLLCTSLVRRSDRSRVHKYHRSLGRSKSGTEKGPNRSLDRSESGPGRSLQMIAPFWGPLLIAPDREILGVVGVNENDQT